LQTVGKYGIENETDRVVGKQGQEKRNLLHGQEHIGRRIVDQMQDALRIQWREADVFDEYLIGNAVVRTDVGRVCDESRVAVRERSRGNRYLGLVHIVKRSEEIAATVRIVSSERDGDIGKLAIALAGNAAQYVDLQSLKVVLEQEVDDAGDGIGTVYRRCATGNDLYSLDQGRRYHADIDRRSLAITRYMTAAVHQNERAIAPETPEVQQFLTGIQDPAALVVVAVTTDPLDQCRIFVHDIAEIRSTGSFHYTCIDYRRRRRQLRCTPRYATARDDDLVDRFNGMILISACGQGRLLCN
jgi:hypothetical protein